MLRKPEYHGVSIVAVVLLLFFSPCAVAKPVPSSGSVARVSPFAATGLLAWPGEPAEEILARAHQRDTRAIVLVVTGYNQGIGGFPKDQYLAAAWGVSLAALGAVDALSFTSLQLWAGQEIPDEALGVKLADCDTVGKSHLVLAFKNAGIFDMESFCASLTAQKSTVPDWEKAYRRAWDMREHMKKIQHGTMAMMRELCRRPATDKELEYLSKAMESIPLDSLLFYAATTHDPDKEAPDWSASRLLAFFAAQAKDPQKLRELRYNRGQEPETFLDAIPGVGTILVRRLSEDSAPALTLIRRAHYGDIDAIAAMVGHYRDGTMGFPKEHFLSQYWRQQAALAGEAGSMLLLAVDWFTEGRWAESWAWAVLARDATTVDAKTKHLAEQIITAIEGQAGENTLQEGRAFVLRYLEESLGWLDERIKIRENNTGSIP